MPCPVLGASTRSCSSPRADKEGNVECDFWWFLVFAWEWGYWLLSSPGVYTMQPYYYLVDWLRDHDDLG